ncbi:MAG: tetratricopeptide repeat protein [Nitrospirota bacterium]
MHNSKDTIRKISQTILISSLLLIVFMTYANRVDDLDLWWHLKQGQLIYETHVIPEKDYLAYTTEIPERISKIGKSEVAPTELPSEENNRYWATNFKNSWLSQLIFYLVYLSGGFIGIGIFKSTIFACTYFVLYLTMLKRGADHLSSFFVLCLVVLIGMDFNYTRPQIFSFLMFTCTLYILYNFRKEGKSIYFLPVLMLLWANLHGGFILGVLIIFTFTFSEFLKYLLNTKFGIPKISSLTKEKLRTLILLSIISNIISLINPNSYKTFLIPIITERSIFATIEEYHRPMLYEYHAYWLMLVMVIIAILILIKTKHLDLTELFLSVIVALPSLRSIRYIIFFALGTGVSLAYSMTYTAIIFKEWGPIKRLLNTNVAKIITNPPLSPFSSPLTKGGYRGVKGGRGWIFSLLFMFVSLTILVKMTISGDVLQFDMGEKRYPSGASEFIQKNKIPGNMFNTYNWGGYLVWHLYPDYRVFICGRTLNETAFFHYGQILKAEKGTDPAMPLWEKLLDAYNVNFILISAVSSNGNIIPLVDMLYVSSNWELIYADGKSMIFLKAIPDNQGIIHRYQLSKERINNEIISECEQGIKDTPATWGYYETLGYMYMKKNRLNEALLMFQKYLSMNPNNKNVRYYYDLLKQYLSYT